LGLDAFASYSNRVQLVMLAPVRDKRCIAADEVEHRVIECLYRTSKVGWRPTSTGLTFFLVSYITEFSVVSHATTNVSAIISTIC
jgi:hypothetical protein